jgi:hypothetical protein
MRGSNPGMNKLLGATQYADVYDALKVVQLP